MSRRLGPIRTRSMRCARAAVAIVIPAACGPSVVLIDGSTDGDTDAAASSTGDSPGSAADSLDSTASTTNPVDPDGTTVPPPDTDGPSTDSRGSTDDGDSTDDGGETSTTAPDPGTSDGGTDASGSTDTGPAIMLCTEPPELTPCDAYDPSLDPLAALGLGCPGNPPDAVPLLSSSVVADAEDSWTVATQLGSHLDPMGNPTFGPRHGESFVVLSNGSNINPDADGRLSFADHTDDSNSDGQAKPAPAPIVWPGMVFDPVAMRFEVNVPEDVSGFALDVAYFSEDFPEFVGTAFNDNLVVWAETETFTGNVCTSGADTCSVTSLWSPALTLPAGALSGTGFQSDGGTPWFTVRGPADPGGTLALTIALFDEGDPTGTSLALLDAFRWECEGCEAGSAVDPCGY